MRRVGAFVFVFLLVVPAAALRAQQTEDVEVSGFDGRQQEESNWCWAASIQSIFRTKGLDVEQSDLVTAAYGDVVNATAPGFDGTLRLLNRIVVDIDGTEWEIHARAGASYPDGAWLLRRFENDEPVMVWYRDEFSNHSIVLHGGTYHVNGAGRFLGWQTVTAYDPYLDRDMTINAPNIPRYVYGTFEISLSEH
jgi:hypothetical protein